MQVDDESIQISYEAEKGNPNWILGRNARQTEINPELGKGKSKSQATIIEEEMEKI